MGLSTVCCPQCGHKKLNKLNDNKISILKKLNRDLAESTEKSKDQNRSEIELKYYMYIIILNEQTRVVKDEYVVHLLSLF